MIDAIAAHTGLVPQPSWAGLLSAVFERHRRTNPVDQVLPPKDSTLWFELAAAVTNGETHFWRHPAQLEWLVEWLAARASSLRGTRPVEVVSLGCSSGEEPYSVAVALLAKLGAAGANDVRILGVDLNPAAVASARRGVYRPWSFRGAPEWLRPYFHSLPDGGAALDARPKQMVRFEQASIPQWSSHFVGHVDAVLFRNVSIYLRPEVTAALHHRFAELLPADGVLVLAPADPSPPSALFRAEPAAPGVHLSRMAPSTTARTRPAFRAVADDGLSDSRRALYLDPRSRLARFAFALALHKAGERAQALGQLRELRRQLEALTEDELLEDGHTTTGALRTQLSAMEEDLS